MTLNVQGGLLEGIRVATGNNSFTYPARSVIVDQVQLDAIQLPSEYMLSVAGQSAGENGVDIGSPSLVFNWTKNQSTLTRFDYDAYGRRWNTLPGSTPDVIGTFGNLPVLIIPVPDLSISFGDAPYSLFLGFPNRLVTFSITFVANSGDFSDPPAGSVEVSIDKGEVNFGSADLSNLTYANQTVYFTRQNFFNRSRNKGLIGSLPSSSSVSYNIFLNPLPGTGQIPRVRIGYRKYLTTIQYATEPDIIIPASGQVAFSLDTGRLVFAVADINQYAGQNIYYDGVFLGSVSLTQTTISSTSSFYPIPSGSSPNLVSPSDNTRYVLFIQPVSGPRFYLNIQWFNIADGLPSAPASGMALVDTSTGNVYISSDDSTAYPTGTLKLVDTYIPIETGVSVQVYRSAINISGVEQSPDFVENYVVTDQVIQDGISSPFVLLPTIPLQDSSLTYSVASAPGGGTFTGPLVDGTNPSQMGLGYLLDLDSKQFKFSNRKTTSSTLQKSTSSIKLNDQAISSSGLVVTRNSATITPGTDFDFDSNSGLIDFIEPVGENDSRNILNFSGQTLSSNRFLANSPIFVSTVVNQSLVITSGPNAGIYPITSFISSSEVIVQKSFPVAQPETASIRYDVEIVADKFFTELKPEYRKITIRKQDVALGPYTTLTSADFSVITQTGQINLNQPIKPGQILTVNYIWLKTEDDGVTVTPTSLTEFASFKIRQETATVVPNTGIINFNPSGKTVVTSKPITLYVDGITVEAENFEFTAPGTLTLPTVLTTEFVTVDYFISESPGGNSFFTLSHSPIDLDRAQLVSGENTAIFNGNVTDKVSFGSAILSDDKDVFLVVSSIYDASNDQTTVVLSPTPEIDTNFAPLKVCGPINGSYSITETNPVDVVTQNSVTVSIQGELPYRNGMIITLDGDPFLVLSATYDSVFNRTNLTLASRTTRNYIIPSVTRTVRPIFNSGSAFVTTKPAHTGYPFTLFLDGSNPRVLSLDVDYNISEGGDIQLSSPIKFGDSLFAFYVARKVQPAGTNFTFNYAYGIVPSTSNGLLGQRLLATYNLLAPDTFFYRTQTISSFIPEVVDEFKKSSVTGTSGPNISSQTTLRTKDQGSASLFFDEQHIGNVDVVVRRLLKFYNDFINQYEDILTGLDGRVVGGKNGRFRYDDQTHTISNYESITNDIDDRIKLFDYVVLTSMAPFTFGSEPYYSYMYESNSLSRLFPTVDPFVTTALNGNTTPIVDYLKTMGSLGIQSITSVSTLTSSRAVASFTVSSLSGADTRFIIDQNGDVDKLIPGFAVGQKVFVYNPDGSLFSGSVFTISAITGTGPYQITVSGVNYPNQTGSLVQDTSDPLIPANHFYTPGRDLLVNPDNGQIQNITYPLPIGSIQVPISGNELMDCSVVFNNPSTAPKRIPVLDSSTLCDNGRVSIPPVNRIAKSEQALLAAEAAALGKIGTGAVQVDLVTVILASPISYAIGDQVTFLNGPNAGITRIVSVINSVTSFEVATAFSSADLPGSDISISVSYGKLSDIVAAELVTLVTSSESAPVAPALIGNVDSELTSIDSVIRGFGTQQVSSNGTALSNILTDGSVNFSTVTPPITSSSLLYIPSGSATGLYRIQSVGTHTLTVNPDSPFPSLPNGGPYPYVVINPWSFLTLKEFKLASEFLAKTYQFYVDTLAWYGSLSLAGVAARTSSVATRQYDVSTFMNRISNLLGTDDRLNDTRFLWIQQRTDRKTGTLNQLVQARQRRVENTEKIVMDQQKLLIANQL